MVQAPSGGCQCGRVRFRAAGLPDLPHVCHCRICQKATGNFFAALVGVPLTDFQVTRAIPAKLLSSEKVCRGYCRDCGAPLHSRHHDNQHISMSIGAFDEPASILLNFQVGMEGRLPQIDQLPGLRHFRATQDEMPEEATQIRRTSNQHPDHDRDDWEPKA